MISLTAAQIADIVEGQLVHCEPEKTVNGSVEFDSRRVQSGSIYVALPGARVDGHDFAAAAVDAGAALCLVAKDCGVPAVILPRGQKVATNAVALAADKDGSGAAAVKAMGLLARYVVSELVNARGLTVVGVTGSAGKTTTKDLIASVLRADGNTIAPAGSFNNEIGLPHTALTCDDDTRYLVAEMSARSVGNIAQLAEFVPPHIGVVLNVGSAHLGEFGSVDAICQAKGELVEALPADGTAILNGDDPRVTAMATRTAANVVYFGVADGADTKTIEKRLRSGERQLVATNVELDELARPHFTVNWLDEDESVQSQQLHLGVHGIHQVSNALAAACVGIAAGLSVPKIIAALEQHRAASERRMAVDTRDDGMIVINDSFNANPDSMRVALQALVHTARSQSAHSVAVLGQMGELGDESAAAHRQLGQIVAELGVDHLVVVGDGDAQTELVAGGRTSGATVTQAHDTDHATEIVQSLATSPTVVLVKASRSDALWRVADNLLADSAESPAGGTNP